MPRRIYSDELKLEIVLAYINGKHSLTDLSRKYHISKGDIQKWRDAYESNGIKGLLSKTKNNSYSGDFKVMVVEYMHNTGSSIRKTAAIFNIPSYTTVADWERRYRKEGKESLYEERRGKYSMGNRKRGRKPKPKQHIPQNEDLLKEIQRLRMENEYLKKLNALAQKREESEKKTK